MRLDDLTAELLDKLVTPGDAAENPGGWRAAQPDVAALTTEIRQRLQSAWEEGQIAMRARCHEASKAVEVLDLAAKATLVTPRVDEALVREGKVPANGKDDTERQEREADRTARIAEQVAYAGAAAALGVAVTEEFA